MEHDHLVICKHTDKVWKRCVHERVASAMSVTMEQGCHVSRQRIWIWQICSELTEGVWVLLMLFHKAGRCHNPDEKELKRVLLGALFLDPGSGVVSKELCTKGWDSRTWYMTLVDSDVILIPPTAGNNHTGRGKFLDFTPLFQTNWPKKLLKKNTCRLGCFHGTKFCVG